MVHKIPFVLLINKNGTVKLHYNIIHKWAKPMNEKINKKSVNN